MVPTDRRFLCPPDGGSTRWRGEGAGRPPAHPWSSNRNGSGLGRPVRLVSRVSRRRTLRMLGEPHVFRTSSKDRVFGSYGRPGRPVTVHVPARDARGQAVPPMAAVISATSSDNGGMPGICSGGSGSSVSAIAVPAVDGDVEEVLVGDDPEAVGGDRRRRRRRRRTPACGPRRAPARRGGGSRLVDGSSRGFSPSSAGQLRSASRMFVRTQPGHSTLTPIGSPAS